MTYTTTSIRAPTTILKMAEIIQKEYGLDNRSQTIFYCVRFCYDYIMLTKKLGFRDDLYET